MECELHFNEAIIFQKVRKCTANTEDGMYMNLFQWRKQTTFCHWSESVWSLILSTLAVYSFFWETFNSLVIVSEKQQGLGYSLPLFSINNKHD